jgi:predicted membrane chloride channel (bestrophin family)
LERNPAWGVVYFIGALWGSIVIGRRYFARQATTLLKFASSTTNPELAAVLIEKAANLKSQGDETNPRPDRSSRAPDVELPPE